MVPAPVKDLRRIALLNRGEPAVRFLRAAREYADRWSVVLDVIAFYTDPDAAAGFVRHADEAVHLGPALRTLPDGRQVHAYCDVDHVLAHVRAAGCDAVWPGWGFVAEDAGFVRRLEDAGIVFIGPSAAAMEALGDKVRAKTIAAATSVPMAPWTPVPADAGPDALRALAADVGYPLLVKAAAGGGGRGIRRVDAADQLTDAVASARGEAERAFGNGEVLLEAAIDDARHIEVQFVANAEGRAFSLGVRDCSVQRRHQKLIEEAPSPVLPDALRQSLEAAAVRLAEAVDYRGVGTAEFLYRPADGQVTFLEVNARLQVEHTVTEMIAGVDIVQAQLAIAEGRPWSPPREGPRGVAIQARLNAEDPEHDFRPAPGQIRVFRPSTGPGVRIDAGVVEGNTIAPEFDSMIAKVIVWGATRDEAIARLRRALRETEVVVENGATNKAFLLQVLDAPSFRDGTLTTRWVDDAVADGRLRTEQGVAAALLVAAVIAFRIDAHAEMQRFFAQANNGVPQHLPAPDGAAVRLRLRGRAADLRVHALGRDRYIVAAGDGLFQLSIEPTGPHSAVLWLDGRRHQILHATGRTGISVEVDGATHTVERATGGEVRAPAPAMVVALAVEAGQTVARGDRVATLEAMKMEMPVYAEESGVVQTVLCRANEQVMAGQTLLVIRPQASEQPAAAPFLLPPAKPLRMDALFTEDQLPQPTLLDDVPEETARAVVEELVGLLQSVFLGFDVPAPIAERIEALFGAELQFADVRRFDHWAPLLDVLPTFVDAEALFDRNLVAVSGESASVSPQLAYFEYCRRHHLGAEAVPDVIRGALQRTLARAGVHSFDPADPLREALFRLSVAYHHGALRHRLASSMLRLVIGLQEANVPIGLAPGLRETLERIGSVASADHPYVADNARQAIYVLYEEPHYVAAREEIDGDLAQAIAEWTAAANDDHRAAAVGRVVASPHAMLPRLLRQPSAAAVPSLTIEVALRRLYLEATACVVEVPEAAGRGWVGRAQLSTASAARSVVAAVCRPADLPVALDRAWGLAADGEAIELIVVGAIDLEIELADLMADVPAARFRAERVTCTWVDVEHRLRHDTVWRTQRPDAANPIAWPDVHPRAAARLRLERFGAFELTRLPTRERVVAFVGRARSNPRDERIFVLAEVTGGSAADAAATWPRWEFERVYFEGLRILREAQATRDRRTRYYRNRLELHVRAPLQLHDTEVRELAHGLEAPTRRLGLEGVHVRTRLVEGEAIRAVEFVIRKPGRHRLEVDARAPNDEPIAALTPYEQRVVRCRRLGCVYPYELLAMLEGRDATDGPAFGSDGGRFVELDLDADGALVAVERPRGQNTCGIIVGRVENRTALHPEGMRRVFLASDPTAAMGALAEPECRRIIAALELAEADGLPVEWVAVSAGARISMSSGTENLDWTARVLRQIVAFTQRGGEINVIVGGVNVGAQAYWNAEATMLMHTRGALIMTREGSMVLTGKRALEFSGSVAAEDERGIGGVDRVMGPNGQAQYVADDLGEAYRILFAHYRYTYKAPGEPGPRRFATTDPRERAMTATPYRHEEGGFGTVGEVFSDATNPGRKRPFAIRPIMGAIVDADGGHLERWRPMRPAETCVVWDAFLGGHAVSVVGIESRPLPRFGRVPVDGPESWSGGTLYPKSSKKLARAINAASGNRPVVVLANLSGFDGSPESLRKWQLEFGAEIGRSVVNFDGRILFVVIGRYHGGAYVVFSKALNEGLTSLALEGSFASVIGGGPAAAVVFPREARKRTELDPRVVEARRELDDASPYQKPRMREALDEVRAGVELEKQGELARAFDAVHTVERAVAVGSLDALVSADALRERLIDLLDEPEFERR